MKKFLAIIISLLAILSIFGCSKEGTSNDTEGTSVDTGTVTEGEKLPDKVITEIYGVFGERYDFIYEDVNVIFGTFTANDDIYNILDALEAEYPMQSELYAKRPPALRYVIKELGATKTDIMKYFAACYGSGITNIIPSDEVINILAGEDDNAVATLCAHPSALAKDGAVYSLNMLLCSSTPASEDEIRATIDRAIEYYGEGVLSYDGIPEEAREKLISFGYIKEEMGGSICSVHKDDYHIIPDALLELVDNSEYEKYKSKVSPTGTECTLGVNIASFVKEFDVPFAKFVEIYDSLGGTMGNYNIELIYSEDDDAIDAYYRKGDAEAEKDIAIDRAVAALKEKISADKGMSDFVTNVHEFSLAEILLMTSRDDAYLASLSEYTSKIPDFTIESIYDNGASYTKMVGKRTPYYIDRLVTGRLTFDTPYEARNAFN